MDASRLVELELSGNVSSHSEVRILINGLRNEARNLLVVSKDMGE